MLFPDIDPRLATWPLMEDGTKTYLIVISYLVLVKIIGPIYMKYKEPYNLRLLMIFYNFGMVTYSAWMFYKIGKHGWFGKYTWICEPVNQSVDEDAMEMVRACWHFCISKIVEMLDTVFFVCRKKDSNISFLHVFHHALVPITARYAASRAPAGFNTLFPFVNTFIHIWMYLYYGLSALGPSVQKYLWWKKYLTILQLIQFTVVAAAMLAYTNLPGCEANPVLIIVSLGQAVLFFVLFAAFYITAYVKKKPMTEAAVTTSSEAITKPRQMRNASELKRRYFKNNN